EWPGAAAASAPARAGARRDRRRDRSRRRQHRVGRARARDQPIDAVLSAAQTRARALAPDQARATGVTMRILVVMDPPERVNPRTDTSYVIMLEAQARGHEVLHCEAADLALEHERAIACARAVTVTPGAPLALGAAQQVWLGDCDAVLMR